MSLITSLQQRIGNWSRRRHGEDPSPIEISHRRIYILPTRLGLVFAAAVIGMGIGGMNYENNLALLLAFLLASLGFVAMHHAHRNLAGLRLQMQGNEPVFAGQLAQMNITLDNPSSQSRLALQASSRVGGRDLTSACITAPAQTQSSLALSVPTQHRGWLSLPHLVLATRYPFGLFRAWTVLHWPVRTLVYPKPSDQSSTPPLASLDEHNTGQRQRGDAEYSGLRPFHIGDSPRRIAWKAYARGQGLQVRQYAGASISLCMLDWDTLQGMDTETRLSRLCRWIIDLHSQGVAYGLKLPGFTATPALSETHRTRCLTALATFKGGA